MKKTIKSLYLQPRFFGIVYFLATGFLISYWVDWLFPVVWGLAVLFLLLFTFDCILLFRKKPITGDRILPKRFSNSDENPVLVAIQNKLNLELTLDVIDEIPVQFQKRDFHKQIKISSGEKLSFEYFLRPVKRGEYYFGKLNIFSSTKIGMAKRRAAFLEDQMVQVYPSFIQMKKLDFLALSTKISQPGFRKIRKLGHTMEFEQIKYYVPGDDIRTINWKATAKQGNLMVNQYQDEISQPVYSIIDISRSMKMPFNNLTLLDYSINSCLAFSNIALKRKDKVGMLTFSNKVGNIIPASSKTAQLNILMQQLYNIKTEFLGSDFGLLYGSLKRKVTRRSLLMLYTNFEHISSMRRQLPYLLSLSKKHILVVILFENTELEELTQKKAKDIPEVFDQTIAEQFQHEKKLIVKELQNYGIQSILTKPEELSINTINKYLEIKKRGIL